MPQEISVDKLGPLLEQIVALNSWAPTDARNMFIAWEIRCTWIGWQLFQWDGFFIFGLSREKIQCYS